MGLHPMLTAIAATRQLSTVRHESPAGWWEIVTGDLHPGLRDYVVVVVRLRGVDAGHHAPPAGARRASSR